MSGLGSAAQNALDSLALLTKSLSKSSPDENNNANNAVDPLFQISRTAQQHVDQKATKDLEKTSVMGSASVKNLASNSNNNGSSASNPGAANALSLLTPDVLAALQKLSSANASKPASATQLKPSSEIAKNKQNNDKVERAVAAAAAAFQVPYDPMTAGNAASTEVPAFNMKTEHQSKNPSLSMQPPQFNFGSFNQPTQPTPPMNPLNNNNLPMGYPAGFPPGMAMPSYPGSNFNPQMMAMLQTQYYQQQAQQDPRYRQQFVPPGTFGQNKNEVNPFPAGMYFGPQGPMFPPFAAPPNALTMPFGFPQPGYPQHQQTFPPNNTVPQPAVNEINPYFSMPPKPVATNSFQQQPNDIYRQKMYQNNHNNNNNNNNNNNGNRLTQNNMMMNQHGNMNHNKIQHQIAKPLPNPLSIHLPLPPGHIVLSCLFTKLAISESHVKKLVSPLKWNMSTLNEVDPLLKESNRTKVEDLSTNLSGKPKVVAAAFIRIWESVCNFENQRALRMIREGRKSLQKVGNNPEVPAGIAPLRILLLPYQMQILHNQASIKIKNLQQLTGLKIRGDDVMIRGQVRMLIFTSKYGERNPLEPRSTSPRLHSRLHPEVDSDVKGAVSEEEEGEEEEEDDDDNEKTPRLNIEIPDSILAEVANSERKKSPTLLEDTNADQLDEDGLPVSNSAGSSTANEVVEEQRGRKRRASIDDIADNAKNAKKRERSFSPLQDVLKREGDRMFDALYEMLLAINPQLTQ